MTDNQEEKINPVLCRMIEYLDVKGIAPTNADKIMGSGNGRFGKMTTNNTKPKLPFIENFLRSFVDVSEKWLKTGEGEMLKDQIKQENELKDSGVPMYNAPGAGGGVEIYTDSDSNKIIGYLNFPGITKGSFALPVYGHSMYPTLESGVWVVLRPIENKTSISWGQVYYIEYDDYRVFKRLLAGDTDDDVVLWSDNQSEVINGKPKFSQVKIKKTEIRRLCLVTDIYKKSNN